MVSFTHFPVALFKSVICVSVLSYRYVSPRCRFKITDPGADGFAFVMQAQGPDAIGKRGNGLCYGLPLCYSFLTHIYRRN